METTVLTAFRQPLYQWNVLYCDDAKFTYLPSTLSSYSFFQREPTNNDWCSKLHSSFVCLVCARSLTHAGVQFAQTMQVREMLRDVHKQLQRFVHYIRTRSSVQSIASYTHTCQWASVQVSVRPYCDRLLAIHIRCSGHALSSQIGMLKAIFWHREHETVGTITAELQLVGLGHELPDIMPSTSPPLQLQIRSI